jgi:Uma2 family endonuclease
MWAPAISTRDQPERLAVPQPRRFTAAEYHRLADRGVLRPDERVELVDGIIVRMAAMNSPHMACIIALTEWLTTRLVGLATVSVQCPLHLSEHSEPQPDVAILKRREDGYAESLPEAADTLLVIEVADTTIRYDRRVKLPMYARAGLTEVWIVDLPRARVLVFRDPVDGGYQTEQERRRGDVLTPLALPQLALPVSEVLPARRQANNGASHT